MRAAAVLLAVPLLAGAAGAAERRCGWFENPTPANYYLVDRAGRWVLSEQGRQGAEGMDDLGNHAAPGWVGDDPRGYGYGCACVVMEADRATRRVQRVVSVEPLPLSRCRSDPALPRRRDAR